MLAKKFRLPIENWFKEKNKKIIAEKGKFFIAKIKDNNLGFSRFGTATSVKVSQSAVKRNKLKRIIFNFIRVNKFYSGQSKDVLFIPLPAAGAADKTQIEKELLSICESLNQ